MNCLEFRKLILVAPRALTQTLVAHRDDCAQCAAFAVRVDKLESSITEAVLVPPPEGLANRILLRRSLADAPPVAVPARRRFLALAASVAAATTGLGAYLFWRGEHRGDLNDDLARELVAHALMAHPPGLGAATQAVSQSDVAGLLARAGFAARGSLGLVANAWPCTFQNQPIAHLVVPAAAAPVTALVIPGSVVRRTYHFAGPDLAGVIAPCANGTLALLTEGDADLEAIVSRFQGVIEAA